MIQETLFQPSSVALVGIPRDEQKKGYYLLKNLVKGCTFYNKYCKPFEGKVYVVNEDAEYLLGFKCYPSIAKIHDALDVVFIYESSDILKVVLDCVKKNVSFIFLLQECSPKILEKVQNAVIKKKTRIIGPCAGGFISTRQHINASFAPLMPREGSVSFLTQSEDIFHMALDWQQDEYFCFQKMIQYGQEMDLDINDLLEYFLQDKDTKVVVVYLETIRDGKRFLQVAKEFTKKKPLFILKGGEQDPFYTLAFKHVGAYVVESIDSLFSLSKAVAKQDTVQKELLLVSNSKNVALLLQKQAEKRGISFLSLKENILKKEDVSIQVNPLIFPLDISQRQQQTILEQLFSEETVKGCVYIHILTSSSQPEECAKMLIQIKKQYPQKTLFVVGLSGAYTEKAAVLLDAEGIPHFIDTKQAVDALHAFLVSKPNV